MLSVEQALQNIEQTVLPSLKTWLVLQKVAGLSVAEPIISPIDSPAFNKSMMDGFAVRACDITQVGTELKVIQRLTAGEVASVSLQEKQAVQVMTGTQLPLGCDAVVPIEQISQAESETIRINVAEVKTGKHVLPQGESLRVGETVLEAGHILRFPQMSLLAEMGFVHVPVFSRPQVAILATGNELVPVHQTPAAGQIRNSNESMLVAQVENAGATAFPLGIARDEINSLQEKIREGLNADFLLLSGGVSAGTVDLVPSVLQSLGVKQVFHKVKLKPGKPIWFGAIKQGSGDFPKRTYVFGLPGNPVSSLVCFELFVRAAFNCFQGRSPASNSLQTATLQKALLVKSDRPVFHPAKITFSDSGILLAEPVRWKGSADIRGTAQANGMIAFAAEEKAYQPGDQVQIQFWHHPDSVTLQQSEVSLS